MDKLKRSSNAVETPDKETAAETVESVGRDFTELAAIFARQLADLLEADHQTRRNIENAKAAAERGIELSRNLRRLLQERK